MRINLLVIFIFLFSFTFVSAYDSYPSQSVDEEFLFCVTCEDASYVTLNTITTPNTTTILSTNMTPIGVGEFCYNYTAELPGRYDFRGVSDGCTKSYAIYVDVDTPNIVAYILMILFFFVLGAIFYNVSSRVDYDAWYDRIVARYDGRNFSKVILSGVVHGFAKQMFMTYYLIGFPIVMLIREIVHGYGLSSITMLIDTVSTLYTVGLAVVFIIVLGSLHELISKLVDQLKDLDWGAE